MMKHTALLAITILIAGVLMAGCLNDGKGDLVYIDDMGTEVRLERTPETVITLTPALTEILFLLGCGEMLVGADSDSNYPPEASDVEHISSWQGLDTERIVDLDPDIIFMDHTLDASNERYGTLIGLGLNVYTIYPKDLDGLMDVISDIGSILGVPEKARDELGILNGRISNVEEEASSDPPRAPVIMHIVYYDGTSDPWVMTDSTFSGDMIERCGGVCAIGDGAGLSVQVGLERIIEADPDIIICSQSSSWPTETRGLVMEDQRLSTLSAVSGDRVFDIDADLIDRTGPRLIDGLEIIRGHVADYHSEE